MIKLAIIGAENTHAWQFASALNGKNNKKLFDDVELLGVYADISTQDGKIGVAKIKELSCCTMFANSYDEFIDDADAVMITLRDGAMHLQAAQKYIRKGIPVWIDKPFACSKEEVCKMINMAQMYKCPLTGGSAIPRLPDVKEFIKKISAFDKDITGGHITAPANMVNNYGGFWFYTQHLVQMMTATFGNDVIGVRAFKDDNGVTAIYFYNEFSVTARFGAGYSICVYDKCSSAHIKEIKINTSTYFLPELYDFYNVIKTGESDMTEKDIAAPVFIIEATINSYLNNKFVKIETI